MRVEFSPEARNELQAIRIWIARDRPRAAAKMVNRLVDAGLSLDRFNNRYPVVAEPDIRRMPVGPYLIFYRVTDQVELLRIIHASRDWRNLLDDPG